MLALLASLGVHLPVYEALGVLAETLLASPEAGPSGQTVEFELPPLQEEEEEVAAAEAALPAPEQSKRPEQPKPDAPEPEVAQEQTPKPVLLPEPTLAQKPPPPPPELVNKQSITQKSDDPEAPPPEDARFVAEENRRVTEETVARVRNNRRDDPEPDPGSASKQEAADAPGAGEETRVADLKDLKGEDRPLEERRAAERADVEAQRAQAQQAAGAAQQQQAPRVASRAQEAQRSAGVPRTGGEPEEIIVEDALGRFVIRRPRVGAGPGDHGGEQPPGSPSAHRHARAGSTARGAANLQMSWQGFEETFGEERLRAQRQSFAAQRRSRLKGTSHGKQWKKFRAAIENYVPNVRPGNQTALNAAASPFAAYLAAVHRRIHQHFSGSFLRNLPIGGGPYDDMNLRTKLEIIINGDGTLHRVGVVETSGFLPFDFGAFSSVQNASPFVAPPTRILSGDGRVYMHWAFHRNHRQCGTFNASPFILPNPPGTPQPGAPGPFNDTPADAEFGAAPAPRPEGERAALDVEARAPTHLHHAHP